MRKRKEQWRWQWDVRVLAFVMLIIIVNIKGGHCCGGQLSDTEGIFTSENHPNNYPLIARTCFWTIQVDFGYVISLAFTSFDVGNEPCTQDYVEVFDDNFGTSLGKFCGDVLPRQLQTKGNAMTISFITKGFNSHKGFAAEYSTAVPPFEVVCEDGYAMYEMFDSSCVDIDECQAKTHNCIHECTNTAGSFTCSCHNGFQLSKTKEGSCDDIDECAESTHGCDHNCSNIPGSYSCSCFHGYSLQADNKTCSDIDECGENTHGCDHNCTNTLGAHVCSCFHGYRLQADNKTCVDIDECAESTHGCDNNCTNTPGSHICTCFHGYRLQADNKTCSDIDECAESTHGCDHNCTNTLGAYTCSCLHGYGLQADSKTCSDIDECALGSHGCSHNCTNTAGSYHCVCSSGYTLDTDNKSCQDIEECALGSHGCSHNCTNTAGSYRCACSSGYTLDTDNKSCQDIDECALGSHGCSHNCSNTAGSYRCVCSSGYTLDSDNKSCQDIDECVLGNHGCSHDCTNTAGTFHCVCTGGFRLDTDNKSCQDIDECSEGLQGLQGLQGCQDCKNTLGSYTCGCVAGYRFNSTNNICEDVDECHELNHGCSHFCKNSPGTYYCSCPSSYVLHANNKTCDATSGALILSYGNTNKDGVLEILYNGSWGTVCDDGWTNINSDLACRLLFGPRHQGSLIPRSQYFAWYNYLHFDILLDDVTCTGRERSLLGCKHRGILNHNCDHSEDVSLECESEDTPCHQTYTESHGSIVSPGYPDFYRNGTDCLWRIISTDDFSKIRFEIYDVNISTSNCRTNNIEVRDGLDGSGKLMASICGAGSLEPMVTSGSSLYVRLRSTPSFPGNRFNSSWTTLCQHTFSASDTQRVLKSPNYPSFYPPNKHCTYLIQQSLGRKIQLSFTHLKLDDRKGSCAGDFIEVRDGPSEYSPLIGKRLCGSSLPTDLFSSQNFMYVTFHSDNTSINSSTGFSATFTDYVPVCSSPNLTSNKGNFSSPGYPHNYPGNVTCQWNIQVMAGHLIELTFKSLAMPGYRESCEGHVIEVFGSATDSKLRYCGSVAVPPIISKGNVMTVVFKSKDYESHFYDRNYNGFLAYYTAINPNDPSEDQYELFPFGPGQRDESVSGSFDSTGHVMLQDGIPYGNSLERDVYISTNGLVSFGQPYIWPYLSGEKKMICAYASLIEALERTGGVYYHLYDAFNVNESVLIKATNEVREFTEAKNFNATTVLLVTWDHVNQKTFTVHSADSCNGTATFQMALISDGTTTYSLMYYRKNGMNWTKRNQWPYIVIGVSDGESSVKESSYSFTSNAYKIDTLKGNTGHKGMWIYQVGHSKNFPSPDSACTDWYARNWGKKTEREQPFSQLPKCPCSLRGVWRRVRDTWVYSRDDPSKQITCYRLSLTSSQRFYPYGKECCYSHDTNNQASYLQLIVNQPDAGCALAFNPAFWPLKADYQHEDKEAHDVCCRQATTHCEKFYELRPIGECQADIPFRFSWMWGDPHITTLDGGEYTFNGWGEYTMVSLNTPDTVFTLQGRTGLAETDNGTLTNATVFTAFGAEENGVKVFVGLDPNTKNSLIIYANGTDYTKWFQEEDISVDTGHFILGRDNNSLTISFPSEIGLLVSVGMKSLDISVMMPLRFQNQTRGLLGNFNGIKDDDFIQPNGAVLTEKLTDRQIFELFGSLWIVSNTTSILMYGPREGPSDYSHPHFKPIFLDEQPSDLIQKAETLCGKTNIACIYDYVATGSSDFASASKETKATADREDEQSKNSLPHLIVPENILITADVPSVITISGTDADNDSLTYRLVDTAGGKLQINSVTGEITATLSASNPVGISVYAEDNRGSQSPVHTIVVILCSGCSGHGHCDNAITTPSKNNPGILHAFCKCHPAFTGTDCSQELDACKTSPCLPEQKCIDLTAEQQGHSTAGFKCTGCPEGFAMDTASGVCVDINECEDDSLNECTGLCNNTGGSYTCSCQSGYRLDSNGRDCQDIDECIEKTHRCQQICKNTQGGYECACYDGYDFDASQSRCLQNALVSTVCNNSRCAHGCKLRDGNANGPLTFQCFCYSGFELDPSNNNTCQDRDECSEGLCTQLCSNNPGSFKCSCYSGYMLAVDQRTCVPCPKFRFGPGCSQTCNCNDRAVDCHPIRGCVCERGWRGDNCHEDFDECEENPDRCGEGKICINNNGSYDCDCPNGYVLDRNGECQDADECADDYTPPVCREMERCSNVPGSFACSCKKGFYREANGECTDIDECQRGSNDCQQKCVNVLGSYNCECSYGYRLNADRSACIQVADVCAEFANLTCSQGCTLRDDDQATCFCDSGYSLAPDNQTCLDIDECMLGFGTCSHECTNTPGAFTCSCPLGMMLDNDRRTCLNCPAGTYGEQCNQTCNCGRGAKVCDARTGCVCKNGWTGERCDRDVNECDTLAVVQECQDKNSDCINFYGGYRCQCQAGYRENENGNCEDIDECVHNRCDQICENTAGSYRCLCQKGFSFNSTSKQCKDINECISPGLHGCTQHCDNTPGSFRCFCNPGFVLDSDLASCKALRNCSRANCPSENGGCSKEMCFCNNGYTLTRTRICASGSEITFAEICPEGLHMCSDGCQTECSEEYVGLYPEQCLENEVRCPDRRCLTSDSDCSTVSSTCEGSDCPSQNGGCREGNCFCNEDYTLITTFSCVVNIIDWCALNVCQHRCHETNDNHHFLCACDDGYLLNNDGRTCRECPPRSYGQQCNQTCTCHEHNSAACDTVTGACTCKPGWTGDVCNDDIDECQTASCPQHSHCVNNRGSYVCACDKGYVKTSALFCEECTDGTYGWQCNETCSCNVRNTDSCDKVNGTCECRAGWAGWTCDDDVDECKEAGSCSPNSNCINTVGSYKCVCAVGYIKTTNDTCIECPQGWYGEGCHTACNCHGNNTISCNSISGACTCKDGWQGSTCDEDVDECLMSAESPCPLHATCLNGNGSHLCLCLPGYSMTSSGSCQECSNGFYGENCTSECHCVHYDSCDHINGSCGCSTGWEGIHCETDVNECKDGGHSCTADHDKCVNTEGSFRCDCEAGYLKDSRNACIKCSNGFYGENCHERCQCSANSRSCDHIDGSCTCSAGWEGALCNLDVDECREDLHNCTGEFEQCFNTMGSFRCDCMHGFSRDQEYVCSDIDECNSSPCVDICQNVPGSFECSCRTGYFLIEQDCLKSTQMKFEISINITTEDRIENFQEDTAYNFLASHVEDRLRQLFRNKDSGFLDIIIVSKRHPIFETLVEVRHETEKISASNLTMALINITDSDQNIGPYSGKSSITVNQLKVTKDTPPCDVYILLSPCDPKQACVAEGGRVFCRDRPKKDYSWPLIVGLGVGLPLAAIAVHLLFACTCRRNWLEVFDTQQKDKIDDDEDRSSVSKPEEDEKDPSERYIFTDL